MFKLFSLAVLIVCLSFHTSESGLVMNNNLNIMSLFGTLFTLIQNQILAQIPTLNTTSFNCTNNVNSVNRASCIPIKVPLLMLNRPCNYDYYYYILELIIFIIILKHALIFSSLIVQYHIHILLDQMQ